MSNKTLVILALVLAVLTVATAGVYLLNKSPGLSVKRIDAGVDWEEVGSGLIGVRMDKGDNRVELTREAEGWKVGQYQADMASVNRLVEGIKKVTVDAVVSETADKHQQYGVNEGQKTKVVLTANGRDYQLGVGESAPGGGFYLTIGDDPKVYLVKGVDRSLFDMSFTDWRDKTVLSQPDGEIASIKVEQAGGTLLISKNNEGKWEIQSGSRKQLFGDETTSRMLRTISSLTALGFVSDADAKTFAAARNKVSVVVTDVAGQETSLSLLEKDGEWWGQVNGEGEVYRLSQIAVDSVVLDPKEVFK